jgi:hypothetical protein
MSTKTTAEKPLIKPNTTEYNMRPIGQVAVDEAWSALRFRPVKEGEAPFTGGA